MGEKSAGEDSEEEVGAGDVDRKGRPGGEGSAAIEKLN